MLQQGWSPERRGMLPISVLLPISELPPAKTLITGGDTERSTAYTRFLVGLTSMAPVWGSGSVATTHSVPYLMTRTFLPDSSAPYIEAARGLDATTAAEKGALVTAKVEAFTSFSTPPIDI